MAGYTLYTGGPYKQNNGSAITALSTDVDGGSAKNISSGENLTRAQAREGEAIETTNLAGNNTYAAADWTSVTLDTSTATFGQSGSYTQITIDGNTNVLAVGKIIKISQENLENLVYAEVLSIVDSTNFICSLKWNSDYSSITTLDALRFQKGTLGTQAAENFIMKKNDATVHGQANSFLTSGAADYGRPKVKRINALRTTRVATAIRTGLYNVYTGLFGTTPTDSNDYASMDTDGTNVPDDEAKTSSTNYGTKGEINYNHGGRAVKSQDYEAKTG